ncbi:hypothetical protein TD95_003392 [Thielaviopsis punctulata]|uniref:Uncharacterized protein n=1 Tax=Thielaviopsis punctulata TaxID=72032 RepID=A0A0F4ZIG0_9PEZI|nr:hypothetical protein TD95_003392 [Thielaviopsis punctulata]
MESGISNYPGRLSFANAPASPAGRVPAFGRQPITRTRTSEIQDSSPNPPVRGSRFRLKDRFTRQRPAPSNDLEAAIPENGQAASTDRSSLSGQSDLPVPEPTLPPNRRPSRRFTGSENPELRLGGDETQSRRERGFRSHRNKQDDDGKTPKHFMFCFPWIKSKDARKQVVRCVISGSFTTIMLAVYLALSIAHDFQQNEFSLLLILVMITSTIIFCHSLARACSLILSPQKETATNTQYNVHGYAIPDRPIPVVLARDEEAVGIESGATKLNPPAYGLWRSSVRVDPNALYWQRNPNARPEEPPVPQVTARPPSYASDDGVTYVVDAVPRSTVPIQDVSMPPRPSEAGRLNNTESTP